MRDQSDELFDQIVYAVCGLLFGEHPANLTIHQRIVAGALRHGGVDALIRTALVSPIGVEPEPKSKLPPQWAYLGGANNG